MADPGGLFILESLIPYNGGAKIFRDRTFRALIVILAVLFIVLAGPYIFASLLERMYLSTLETEMRYNVILSIDSPLASVTLFIPVPSDTNGTSPVIERIGRDDRSSIFPGWNISVYGANDASYLKIWTETLPGPIAGTDRISYQLSVVTPVKSALHTRDPVQYDYTLLPKYNLTGVPCEDGTGPNNASCYRFGSTMYASYLAPGNATVSVEIDLQGVNHWRILRDYQNSYLDRIKAVFAGSAQGWYAAEGAMKTSIGDDNPYWKERIEPKVSTNLTGGIDTSMMRWHTVTPLP